MAEKNKRLKKNFSGVLILLLLLLSLWQYSSSGVKAENNAAITKSIIWTIYAVGEAGAARRPSIAADINKISTFILPAGKYKVAGQMYYNKKIQTAMRSPSPRENSTA
jgi:hypothetical protein